MRAFYYFFIVLLVAIIDSVTHSYNLWLKIIMSTFLFLGFVGTIIELIESYIKRSKSAKNKE